MAPLSVAVLLWAGLAAPAAAQTAVPPAAAASYAAGKPLPRPAPEGLAPQAQAAYALALDVEDGCRAGEDAAAYRERAALAAESLGLAPDAVAAARAAYARCRPRAAGADPRPLDPALEAAVVRRELAATGLASDRRAALESRARRLADLLGRPAQATDDGVVAAAGAPAPPTDAAAVARRLNAAQPPARGLHTSDVPSPTELHALASEEVAPTPSLVDRAGALLTRSGPLVAQDLATIRSALALGESPDVLAINPGNSDAVREFYAWMKTVKDSDLPSISYGILAKGEIGRYDRGLLGKGSITVNYLYWDNEVARDYYSNVSYGYIDPAHLHKREYDAYLVTGLYWSQHKTEGASSPLALYLDRLPTDRDEVRAMVDKTAGGHE